MGRRDRWSFQVDRAWPQRPRALVPQRAPVYAPGTVGEGRSVVRKDHRAVAARQRGVVLPRGHRSADPPARRGDSQPATGRHPRVQGGVADEGRSRPGRAARPRGLKKLLTELDAKPAPPSTTTRPAGSW